MAFRVFTLAVTLVVARAAEDAMSQSSSRAIGETSSRAHRGDGDTSEDADRDSRAASANNVTLESRHGEARAATGSLRGSVEPRSTDSKESQQPADTQGKAAHSHQGGWQQFAGGQGWQKYTSGGGNYAATYMKGGGQGFDWQQYTGGQGGQGGFSWQKFAGGASPSGSKAAESKGPAARAASAGAEKKSGGLVPGKGGGFQGYIDKMLPPGDADAYVRKNTGTWSNMSSSQMGSYSDSYSKFVNKYEAMAGKSPAAPGDWQNKSQEQARAYGQAVGQDVPGHADNHYQNMAHKNGSSSEAAGPTQLSVESDLASRGPDGRIVALVLGSACCLLALSVRVRSASQRYSGQLMHPNQEPLLVA